MCVYVYILCSLAHSNSLTPFSFLALSLYIYMNAFSLVVRIYIFSFSMLFYRSCVVFFVRSFRFSLHCSIRTFTVYFSLFQMNEEFIHFILFSLLYIYFHIFHFSSSLYCTLKYIARTLY